MTDNVIKSTDVDNKTTKKQPAKKAPAKKAVAKKTPAVVKDEETGIDSTSTKVIIFESGSSYTSGDYVFTRENPIQEIPEEVANRLLEIENFRLPDQLELEEYLNNKE